MHANGYWPYFVHLFVQYSNSRMFAKTNSFLLPLNTLNVCTPVVCLVVELCPYASQALNFFLLATEMSDSLNGNFRNNL